MSPKVLHWVHIEQTLCWHLASYRNGVNKHSPHLKTQDIGKIMLLIKSSWGYWISGKKPRIKEVRVLQGRVLEGSDCIMYYYYRPWYTFIGYNCQLSCLHLHAAGQCVHYFTVLDNINHGKSIMIQPEHLYCGFWRKILALNKRETRKHV